MVVGGKVEAVLHMWVICFGLELDERVQPFGEHLAFCLFTRDSIVPSLAFVTNHTKESQKKLMWKGVLNVNQIFKQKLIAII